MLAATAATKAREESVEVSFMSEIPAWAPADLGDAAYA
jgi:hypothetical protein